MPPTAASRLNPITRLTGGLRRWRALGLNLLFPPVCSYCETALDQPEFGQMAPPDRISAALCPACHIQLQDRRPACRRCGSRLPNDSAAADDCPQCQDSQRFSGVTRLGSYEGPLRLAVLRLKRAHERALAVALGDSLADYLASAIEARPEQMRFDVIVPIPMHWTRRARRGTNSAETIAARLANRLRLPLAPDLLARRRRTAPQASLSPGRRKANVRGAFRVRPHADLAGARVLLVDDILTTGATLNEAGKMFAKAGAADVAVAVLARAEGQV
jgi:ComF family protein